MELGVFFVFLGGLSLCAGLVFVFSFFGVQSETYEEALKKQKEANKKEKKEKKQTTEKKKKVKKGKEPKNNNVIVKDFDDQVLVEGSGAVVEPVFVQPPAAVEIAKPKKEVKKEPKKKEEKKKAAEPKVEIPAAEPEPENLSVKEKQAVFEKQTVVEKKAVVEKPAVVEKKAVVEAKIEAAAVQTSAAPVPQKKKIEIQEVGDVKTDEAEEKKKKKGGKDSKPKKSNKSNYDEILAVIRKSPLSSSEAQGIVDLLLVKQTGKDESMDGDDWIEPGKESEAKKTARLLSDLTAELEEEKSKSSTWEKKIQTIRKELNESRSVASGHKREMDELTSKKNNEIATLNARLTQNSVQFNTMTDRSRQLETNQAQYQTTINNLKTQLSQVAQPAVDSKMSGDMEQLKNAKIELTASNTSLQQKFKTKCDEVETLTTDKQKLTAALDTAAAGKKQMEANLASAAQEKDALVQEKAALSAQLESQQAGNENLSSSKQQFDAQLSTITAAKTQLQQDLSALKEKLSGKEVECSRLLEENERLSEQVASSVERPAAEGEEAVKVNGHQEVPQAKTVSDPWEEKYKEAEEKYMELSLKLKQIDAKSEGVEEELSSTKAELSKLRTKNDTDVSAFSSYKAECAGVFGRLVPTLKADSDLSAMEKQAKEFIQSLEASSSSGPQVEDLSEEITKLEAQTLNYKTVLAQTENMLTTLQASVESAEGEWKKKLQVVESECREFKSNTESLKSSNEQLQSRVKELEGDGATLERLAEELEAAKDSKNALAKKCSELQELVVSGQQQINNTTQLQNNVGGSGPKQGFVHVTVHQAQDLMDKDISGKSDPYVILKYNDHVVQSKVVDNNLNPVFEFEEVFVFADTKSFSLTLKDKDITTDELLGCTEVDFSSVLGGAAIKGTWINLDKAKKGRVQVSVKFSQAEGGVPNGSQDQA